MSDKKYILVDDIIERYLFHAEKKAHDGWTSGMDSSRWSNYVIIELSCSVFAFLDVDFLLRFFYQGRNRLLTHQFSNPSH